MLVPPGEMIFKHATVKGFWGSKASREMPVADKRRLVGELLQRAVAGELKLPWTRSSTCRCREGRGGKPAPGRNGKVMLRADATQSSRRKVRSASPAR